MYLPGERVLASSLRNMLTQTEELGSYDPNDFVNSSSSTGKQFDCCSVLENIVFLLRAIGKLILEKVKSCS